MRLRGTYRLFSGSMILMLAIVCLAFSSSAQEIQAIAKLDTNNIRIGQQVKLQLSIHYRVDNGKQIKIQWPAITDTIRKEIEVVGQTKTDTVIPDINNPFQFVQSKTLYITSFDSGFWAIPPFKFIVNGDSNGIYSEPLLLQVTAIAVDTTVAIKDIKPPFAENYSWMDWLKDNMIVVYGGLAAILIILSIIYLIRHYKKIKPIVAVKEAPKTPAHIIAFGKLEMLKNEKLWQSGKLKQYHSTLTDIIREYIENRYKIKALEQTTDEILFGFRNIAIDDESRIKLKQMLILADLVKFAKEQALPDENESSLTNAFDFVKGTMREESPAKSDELIVKSDELIVIS